MKETSQRPPYRMIATPGGTVSLNVISNEGIVHLPLTIAAAHLCERAPATAEKYLGYCLTWVSWLDRIEALDPSTDEVPGLVIRFLREHYGCRVRRSGQAWVVSPVFQAPSTIRAVVSALLEFYDAQLDYGLLKAEINPLRRSDLRNRRGDPCGRFIVRGGQWRPRRMPDPDLRQVMNEAAERDGWPPWAKLVLRILFDAGPRIAEVCSLTLADWLVSNCGTVLSAPSKGSAGRRVKWLTISRETATQLEAYCNGPRRQLTGIDLHGLREAVASGRVRAETIPLLLTRQRFAPTPDAFRKRHWNPTARRLGLKQTPHCARHWFVTAEVARILQTHGNSPACGRQLALLCEYMHWANGMEMINVYAGQLAVLIRQSAHREPVTRDLFIEAEHLVQNHPRLRELVGDGED